MQRIAHTPIAADWFHACAHVRFYFLSHMHADHLVGLCDGWSNGVIYCSRVSRQMLLCKFDIEAHRVIALEVGTTHSMFLDEDECEVMMNVTLMDANHCPGAVMFLWEAYFGTILYTGDFRAHPAMARHPALEHKRVHTLYLDNTYAHPQHHFDPHAIVLQRVRAVIDAWRQQHHARMSRIVVLLGMDTLGKEGFMRALATAYNTRVAVGPRRWRTLCLCDLVPGYEARGAHLEAGPDARATGPWSYEADLEREPLAWITRNADVCHKEGGGTVAASPSAAGQQVHIACVPKAIASRLVRQARAQGMAAVLAVRPTGMCWGATEETDAAVAAAMTSEEQLVRRATHRAHTSGTVLVPYSIHSSFHEMEAFVKQVQPCKIVPIVPSLGMSDALLRWLDPSGPPPRPETPACLLARRRTHDDDDASKPARTTPLSHSVVRSSCEPRLLRRLSSGSVLVHEGNVLRPLGADEDGKDCIGGDAGRCSVKPWDEDKAELHAMESSVSSPVITLERQRVKLRRLREQSERNRPQRGDNIKREGEEDSTMVHPAHHDRAHAAAVKEEATPGEVSDGDTCADDVCVKTEGVTWDYGAALMTQENRRRCKARKRNHALARDLSRVAAAAKRVQGSPCPSSIIGAANEDHTAAMVQAWLGKQRRRRRKPQGS